MIKKAAFFLPILIVAGLLVCSTALAHFLWMDPIGLQEATVGQQVSVEVYLHAEQDDLLHAWSLSLGFDDTSVDGGELTFLNLTYGTSVLTMSPATPDAWYQAGGSVKYPGEGAIRDISRFDLIALLPAQPLTSGEDFLLFTATFEYDGGAWGDAEDVWIEDIGPDGWDFESVGGIAALDIYTDNTKTTLLGAGGPDYGKPVPGPAPILLIGSGLAALVGIKKKKGKVL